MLIETIEGFSHFNKELLAVCERFPPPGLQFLILYALPLSYGYPQACSGCITVIIACSSPIPGKTLRTLQLHRMLQGLKFCLVTLEDFLQNGLVCHVGLLQAGANKTA